MAEVCPELKRDSTMTATAKEGEVFLENAGKVHEDAKTRAQQKEIEENANCEETTGEDSPSKLTRTTTMAETAKEGKELLDGEDLGKTRAETEKQKEETNGSAEHNGADGEVPEEKPDLKRETTMEVTAKEGAELLEGHDTEAGTRAEAKAVQEAMKESAEENGEKEEEKKDENEEKEEEKPDLKRKTTMEATVEEGQEFIKKKKESDEAEIKA